LREKLLDALRNFTGTVVLVSHDRNFLRSLVDRLFEIDHCEMRVYEGDYSNYLEKTGNAATIAGSAVKVAGRKDK
jgi:ATP-binding cassette subfamily F protein 3